MYVFFYAYFQGFMWKLVYRPCTATFVYNLQLCTNVEFQLAKALANFAHVFLEIQAFISFFLQELYCNFINSCWRNYL